MRLHATFIGALFSARITFVLIGAFSILQAPKSSEVQADEADPKPLVLRGHNKLVAAVAFAPDGRHLVSGAWDGTARIWDLETGRQLGEFIGHTSYVISVAISPDGKLVATGGHDGTVRLWNLATRSQIHHWSGLTRHGPDVAFSPDGQILAITDINQILLIDSSTYAELRRIVAVEEKAIRHYLDGVRFSQDGKWIMAAAVGSSPRIWDVITARELAAFHATRFETWRVALSPDCESAVTASQDGLRLWDAKTGVLRRSILLEELGADFGCAVGVCEALFSPDGKLILAAGGNSALWLFDTRTWKPVSKYYGGPGGKRSRDDYFACAAYSRDGRMIAAGSTDGSIWVWHLAPIEPGN